MKRSSIFLSTIFVGALFAFALPKEARATTIITGHTYVNSGGLTKYLKNVVLKWTILTDTDPIKACPVIDGWYRIVKSGDKFSYSYLPDGSQPNPPTNPPPPPAPTPTPKRYPKAKVNCKKEVTGYNYTCKTNSEGFTYDTSDTSHINYVFQRTDCFGCRHQTGTLIVGPPPASELPSGVSTDGHWEFRDTGSVCGGSPAECTVKTDANGNAYLEFTDIGNNDKFSNLDFEWIPDAVPTSTPTATPTITPTSPQCGAPCTTPGPNSSECPQQCPNCVPTGSGNTCQAPSSTPSPSASVTPTPTRTPTPTGVSCGGPCSSNSECDIACPICYIGANGGTCQAPTATPTVTPTATPAPPSSTPTAVPPSATPTPFCECDGLFPTASPNWTTGSTLSMTGYGKISNPATNNAYVQNMVFSLKKGDGTDVANSGLVTALGPTVIPNPSALRYASSWSTTIPGPGSYRAEVKLNCWAPRPGTAQNSGVYMSQQRETVVLQSSSRQGGIFGFFSNLFGALFGRPAVRTQSPPPPTITPTPTPFDPLSSDALKLGTFNPLDPNLEIGCTWAEFTVVQ